jgi:hypothetical protein
VTVLVLIRPMLDSYAATAFVGRVPLARFVGAWTHIRRLVIDTTKPSKRPMGVGEARRRVLARAEQFGFSVGVEVSP